MIDKEGVGGRERERETFPLNGRWYFWIASKYCTISIGFDASIKSLGSLSIESLRRSVRCFDCVCKWVCVYDKRKVSKGEESEDVRT